MSTAISEIRFRGAICVIETFIDRGKITGSMWLRICLLAALSPGVLLEDLHYLPAPIAAAFLGGESICLDRRHRVCRKLALKIPVGPFLLPCSHQVCRIADRF